MPRRPPFLLILRGNSAAGKSTLAGGVQRAIGRGTALVGQDHLRRIVLREHDVADGDNIGLIDHTVRYCLSIGYDVVLEGILVADHYGAMLRRLVADHTGPTHVVYLDVPLEETLRRHEGRPLRAEVGPESLREWHVEGDVLGIPGEVRIDAGRLAPEATLALLLDLIGPVEPQREDRDGRFL